jgi:hypothetical protein
LSLDLINGNSFGIGVGGCDVRDFGRGEVEFNLSSSSSISWDSSRISDTI